MKASSLHYDFCACCDAYDDCDESGDCDESDEREHCDFRDFRVDSDP